ncbi:MAG TPA: DHHA1 domain-containing protein [Pyrinomonadaceae bacterium]|jgi:alanyl-tRNA synthetase
MHTTERLYYHDSHLLEFTARVMDVAELAPGRFGVKLDRTAFYPTGGGQPTDTGLLANARVVECIDQADEGVLHVVEGSPPVVGAEVAGRVDWARRLDHIQQHTGQHILSQALVSLFNAPTRAFRMLAHVAEIDVELAEPSLERIEQAVDHANHIIWADRPIQIHNVTPAEAARLPLRKDSARAGELRIIEIKDFDMSPCGGTHARATGEVGLIAVRAWERAKGMTRLEFVAGQRALADYRRANDAARQVAALFSAARDEALAAVARLLAEHKELTRRIRTLEEHTARYEAEELLANAMLVNGTRLVAHTFDNRAADALKRLALALIAHPPTVALLGSRDGDDARLVFARSPDAPGDMNALMRAACTLLGGRGGGRADMAQGGGRNTAQLAEALATAVRSLT